MPFSAWDLTAHVDVNHAIEFTKLALPFSHGVSDQKLNGELSLHQPLLLVCTPCQTFPVFHSKRQRSSGPSRDGWDGLASVQWLLQRLVHKIPQPFEQHLCVCICVCACMCMCVCVCVCARMCVWVCLIISYTKYMVPVGIIYIARSTHRLDHRQFQPQQCIGNSLPSS